MMLTEHVVVSTLLGIIVLTLRSIHRVIVKPKDEPVPPKWVLSMITAYNETEEQIIKTIYSVRRHDISPHRQVLCVVVDGKPKQITKYMTSMVATFHREYTTFRWQRNELCIHAGFIGQDPIILFEKLHNAGKKDSLILGHDIFNITRDDAPLYTRLLKDEIFKEVLPLLTGCHDSFQFDMIFCTDADSVVHENAIRNLVRSLALDPRAIGACGVLLAETLQGQEWSSWHLYQQFQVCDDWNGFGLKKTALWLVR
jgi:cellulose synthase/poly-beta-1,6-N-acetylglucosamine synthase-like glycosyltransferase